MLLSFARVRGKWVCEGIVRAGDLFRSVYLRSVQTSSENRKTVSLADCEMGALMSAG